MKALQIVVWVMILVAPACGSDNSEEKSATDAGFEEKSPLDAGLLDADVDARSVGGDFIPRCQIDDGRCQACLWTEGSAQRCTVTIFPGLHCTAGSTLREERACPANPVAACDRSPGYFDPNSSTDHGDGDFYYGTFPAMAQQACLAGSTLLTRDAGIRWQTFALPSMGVGNE
jgi:hypothetical protein